MPSLPTICNSISSILALTPESWRAPSDIRTSESSTFDEPPSAASCSGDSPSRRSLRSTSNSRLRTKSLRRLRSIIALISVRSSSWPSSGRVPISDQSVAGLATKRTTLRKKLSPSLDSAMWVREMRAGRAGRSSEVAQSPNIFCFISRRCCASSDKVAVGRANKRPRPIGSPVSSQKP